MVFVLFFKWWYGQGWLNSFARIGQRASIVANELSLPILVRTLFEPWKQITSYAPSTAPLELKFRAWFDNVFARLVGFVIRSATILFCLLSIVFVALTGFLIAIIWPVVPLTPVVFILLGLV